MMKQINFYHALPHFVNNTACGLTEKCYLSNLKVVILTSSIEDQEKLNRALWTYGKIKFIPHGSKSDPLPSKHPVYITSELENPNNAKVLIFLNNTTHLTQITSEFGQHFTKIIIISDNPDQIQQINQIIKSFVNCSINCFIQDQDKKWREITNTEEL